jgi:G3E family GTPase
LDVDIVAGYLGAGKTTSLLGLIAADPDPASLVVLVNEFGEIGIDGLLISGSADVVELKSGCICCTLRLDFRAQIMEIFRTYAPRRLLIEPTGVATIAQVVRALCHADLVGDISGARVIVVVDAVTFAKRLRDSPGFFTSQVAQADVVLLNKIDLVEPARVKALHATLETMAPGAWIIPTDHGHIDDPSALPAPHPLGDPGEAEVLQDLESLSYTLSGMLSRRALVDLLQALAGGAYGEVDRAKGIVESDEGWLRLDLASGQVDVAPSGPVPGSRLVVIGRGLRTAELQAALNAVDRTAERAHH